MQQVGTEVGTMELEVLAEIQRIAYEVERAACARIAEEYADKCEKRGPSWEDQRTAALSIAEKIRNRRLGGNTK